MRTLLSFLMLALLTAAPLALAQEETKPEDNSTRPDDAAWTEDCPPDMMCAFGGADETPEDGATYDGNCGGEVCAYGGEDCIECSGPVDEPRDAGSNCMDGQQENETCRDDVQYMTPPEEPTRGPADGSCEYCRGDASDDASSPSQAAGGDDAEPVSAPAEAETQSDAKSAVPAPAVAVGILALAGAALLVLPRRK